MTGTWGANATASGPTRIGQLDLASGRIDKVTADQRAAAVQTTMYTATLAALRQELSELNKDLTIAPEEKRVRGLGIQNRISDLEGQHATQMVQDQVRQASDSDNAGHIAREQADAVAALTEAQQKNAEAMQQMALAHDAATGAITREQAVEQLAALHASEFAAQTAKLQQERVNVQNDPKLTDQQKQLAVTKLDVQLTDVSGEAARGMQQDRWNEFSTTAIGGAVSALEKFDAAAEDSASQLARVTSDAVKGINNVLLKQIGSKNYTGVDFRRDLRNTAAGDARNVAGVGLEKGEAALFNPLVSMLGQDGKASGLLAALGLSKGKQPTGAAGDPLHVVMANAAAAAFSNPLATAAGGALSPVRGIFPDLGPSASLAAGLLDTGSGSAEALKAAGGLYPSGANAMPSFSTIPPGVSGVGSTVGKTVADILPLIPGFASGTEPLSDDTWAMVGENGPELAYLRKGTGVVPNHKLGDVMGGGFTHTGDVHVDARGSSDAAATEAAVRRGYRAAVRDSQSAMAHSHAENKRRTPGLAQR